MEVESRGACTMPTLRPAQELNAIMLGGATGALGGAGPYSDSAARVRLCNRVWPRLVRVYWQTRSSQVQAAIKAAAADASAAKLKSKAGGKNGDRKKWTLEETVALVHLHNVAMKKSTGGGPSEQGRVVHACLS